MEKTNIQTIMAMKGYIRQNLNSISKSAEQIREAEITAQALVTLLPNTKTITTKIADLPAEWVIADNVKLEQDNMVLYFHGGSFVSGSCGTHRDLAARISKTSGVRVLVIEYRLAPENKYPAANDDCLSAYQALLKSGVNADNIVLGGESTGGYLVLSTLLALRDAGDELPKGAFLLSPHLDFLYYDGDSYKSRAEADPCGSLSGSKTCADYYFDTSINDSTVLSPLNQNLKGLPSLFVQVGDAEVLLDDSTRLVQYAKDTGVDATLEVWDNMWHIFRFMASILPEGQQAIDSIGRFVQKCFYK